VATPDDLRSFVDKWRARWPEWRVGEAFLPARRRAAAMAWFCLRQELGDAAWSGADVRPGEAKLGWWADELQGWRGGARRHPLGRVLQPLPAPWDALARALPALAAARERAADFGEARALLAPFATVAAGISTVLDGEGTDPVAAASAIADGMLAQRLLAGDRNAVPLQALARVGAGAGEAALRSASAAMLLQDWPDGTGLACAERLQLAFAGARLRECAGGADPGVAPAPWRVLFRAWRVARHSIPQA
jgi:hypothetical protein